MNSRIFRTRTPLLCACLLLLSPALSLASNFKRDHLTPEEADRVRDAQMLDQRVDVFIKAAGRRLLVLTNPNAASVKPSQKELENWGELPKGTRAELLADLAQIIEEASDNIDDASIHESKAPLVPKALRKLAAACTHFLTELKPMRDVVTDRTERKALEDAIENAQTVIDAVSKLPPEEPKAKGKGKKP